MFYNSKIFGSAMIIAGTSIGAGMLAIPATVAAFGFVYASILIIFTWLIMLTTALLLTQLTLAMPRGINLGGMAHATLGKLGRYATWCLYLLLLYSLTAAYITGGGGLISHGLNKIHLY